MQCTDKTAGVLVRSEGGTPDTEMAEGEGFEPPVPLRVRLISSQVPSTTQPPFRDSLSPKPVRSGGLRKTVAPAKAPNVFLRCYATGFPASPASPKTALSCDPPQDPRPRKIRMLREWAIANASRHQTAAGPIPWCLQRKALSGSGMGPKSALEAITPLPRAQRECKLRWGTPRLRS